MKIYSINIILLVIGLVIIFNQFNQYNKIKKNNKDIKKNNKDIINLKKKELMTNTNSKLTPELKHKINDYLSATYQADIESIRNLSRVATKLQKQGLTIPGNLKVTGKFNYLPRGVIMAYNSPTAPPGWAICDGKNGTPDLRGKFIRMHTNGLIFNPNGNSSSKTNLLGSYNPKFGGHRWGSQQVYRLRQNFGSFGGSDLTVQDPIQMAAHSHVCNMSGNHNHPYGDIFYSETGGNIPVPGFIGSGSSDNNNMGFQIVRNTTNAGKHSHKINNTGGGYAMNNQPSYYVLTWIMKL